MTGQTGKRFAIQNARSRDQPAGTRARIFVGLQLDRELRLIRGALLRVLGRGFAADLDVVGTAESADDRIELAVSSMTGAAEVAINESTQAAALAEAAAEVVHSLTAPVESELGDKLAVALGEFGVWQDDPIGGRRFHARCDTGLLAKLTGLTVVDDFPSRDLADGGRGGPMETAGVWMLLADRGTIPGRRIRALLEVNDVMRLTLLPPRQTIQLPSHLLSHDLAPALNFKKQITRKLVDEAIADHSGKLAVQGRHRASLLQVLQETLGRRQPEWSPWGPSLGELVAAFDQWTIDESISLHDALCTLVHLLADRVAHQIREKLPRSQPIGQLILSGADRHNGLLVREIQRRLPEIDLAHIDDWGIPSDSLPAAAIAALGQLHIDQIPTNSPALTGTDIPRILGRLTPGNPASWHQLLASIAQTLPDKLPLRNAI